MNTETSLKDLKKKYKKVLKRLPSINLSTDKGLLCSSCGKPITKYVDNKAFRYCPYCRHDLKE